MNKKAYLAIRAAMKELLQMCDTKEESIREVHRYKREFPHEIDYNIAQYGNVRIYYDDARDFFRKLKFKSAEKVSDKVIWNWYKWYIGQAADRI